VWIIAATSEDLEAAVLEGRFSADLYQQLGQLDLLIPPLRERPDDILLIAEHCLGRDRTRGVPLCEERRHHRRDARITELE
jgi:transcriptional regulator with GAF, ATPase, and Fis domain